MGARSLAAITALALFAVVCVSMHRTLVPAQLQSLHVDFWAPDGDKDEGKTVAARQLSSKSGVNAHLPSEIRDRVQRMIHRLEAHSEKGASDGESLADEVACSYPYPPEPCKYAPHVSPGKIQREEAMLGGPMVGRR
jgi:hypothetical protein